MKILQVIPYFVPAYSYGGPIKVCFDLSKELATQGHSVTVVTTDTLDGKRRIEELEEELDGIRVIRFRNLSNRLAKKCNGYLPIGFYSWTKKNLSGYDIVYCHDFFTYQNLTISHLCRKRNIPFIIEPHGALSPIRQASRFSWIKKIFIFMFKGTLKNSKKIIALTETEKKEMTNLGIKEEKIEIIPNGLNLKEFENINKINLYSKYNIPGNNKIIGYFGRLQYIKGIDISLEVLSLLKDRLAFTFLIIGPDEGEKEKLETMAKGLKIETKIIFTGILTGKEKLETIRSCDLFLFTSRSEGLPITVLEIAALGIPQILSKNCNVPEIEKGGAGFEFNLQDRQKMADKIMEILSDQNLYNNLSENSKKMVSDYFDLNLIVQKLTRVLTE